MPSGIRPSGAYSDISIGSSFYSRDDSNAIGVLLSAKDVLRLNYVARYLAALSASLTETTTVPIASKYLGMGLLTRFSLVLYEPNLSHLMQLLSFNKESIIHLLAIVLIPYGAVHLAALGLEFPSSIERILWESSCYVLLGGAGVIIFAYVATSCFDERL